MSNDQALDLLALRGHLVGARVSVRPFSAADISATYLAWLRDPAVVRFSGQRFDCGSKLGYLQATVAYALAHPQLGSEFRAHLRRVVAAGDGRSAAQPKRSAQGRLRKR